MGAVLSLDHVAQHSISLYVPRANLLRKSKMSSVCSTLLTHHDFMLFPKDKRGKGWKQEGLENGLLCYLQSWKTLVSTSQYLLVSEQRWMQTLRPSPQIYNLCQGYCPRRGHLHLAKDPPSAKLLFLSFLITSHSSIMSGWWLTGRQKWRKQGCRCGLSPHRDICPGGFSAYWK